MRKKGPISLTLEYDLLEDITKIASDLGVSKSETVSRLLRKTIEAQNPPTQASFDELLEQVGEASAGTAIIVRGIVKTLIKDPQVYEEFKQTLQEVQSETKEKLKKRR